MNYECSQKQCEFKSEELKLYRIHLIENHLPIIIQKDYVEKYPYKYECKECIFYTDDINEYEKHIKSFTHIININSRKILSYRILQYFDKNNNIDPQNSIMNNELLLYINKNLDNENIKKFIDKYIITDSYCCDFCTFTTSCKRDYRYHIKDNHNKITLLPDYIEKYPYKYCCDLCSFYSDSISPFKIHIESVKHIRNDFLYSKINN